MKKIIFIICLLLCQNCYADYTTATESQTDNYAGEEALDNQYETMYARYSSAVTNANVATSLGFKSGWNMMKQMQFMNYLSSGSYYATLASPYKSDGDSKSSLGDTHQFIAEEDYWENEDYISAESEYDISSSYYNLAKIAYSNASTYYFLSAMAYSDAIYFWNHN